MKTAQFYFYIANVVIASTSNLGEETGYHTIWARSFGPILRVTRHVTDSSEYPAQGALG